MHVMYVLMQMDRAHAPQPRANGKWVNHGGTFKAEIDHKSEEQLSFRRSLKESMRPHRANSIRSIQPQQSSVIIPQDMDI